MASSQSLPTHGASLLLLPLLVPLLGFPAVGCEDEGVRSSGQPQINVDPPAGEFGQVQVGRSISETFTISNDGSANLVLLGIFISPAEATYFSVTQPERKTLPPGEQTTVDVIFRPIQPGVFSAKLVIECNDRRVDGRVEVPLNTQRVEGDIFAVPALIDFGSVEPDTERVLHTDVINSGSAAVEVSTVQLFNEREPNDFRITSLGLCSEVMAAEGEEAPELDPGCTQATGLIVLHPGARLRIKVLYHPTGGDVDEARIRLATNLERHATFDIAVLGSEPSPRLALIPPSLDFGPTPPEGKTLSATIRNVGSGQLELSSIYVAAGTADFTLVESPPAGTVLRGEVTICGGCVCVCTTPEAGDDAEEVVQEDVPQMECLREVDCGEVCGQVEGRVPVESGAPAACTEPVLTHDDKTLSVQYVPSCGASGYLPASSKLFVRSNDRTAPAGGTQVALLGRLDAPGIDVRPTELDFNVVPSGEEWTLSFRIYNVGSQPLEVTRLELTQAGGGNEFRLLPQGDVSAIPAGDNVEVQVAYRPAAEHASSGEVLIEHAAPCGGAIRIPLTARGGGQPYCGILVSPLQLNFGTVATGRVVSKGAQVRSIGTGSCHFIDARIEASIAGMPTGQPSPVFSRGAVPGQLIRPMETPEVEVVYTPVRGNLFTGDNHEGVLIVRTSDPDGANPKTHTVQLRGSTGNSEIQVLPGDLDFGLTTLGCASQTLAVTVYNVGVVNLTIDSITIDPPLPEFEIVAMPDLPATVNRALPAQVEVRYVPQDVGVDRADLVFVSDAQNGAEYRVPMRGEGTLLDDGLDEYVQAEGATVDVLFVVDDSGSMGDDQDNLARNFRHFVEAGDLLAPDNSVDFHIGVITTDLDGSDNPFDAGGEMGPDRGKLRGNPRIITNQTANFQAAFEENIHVGSDDSGAQESGLETARAALDPVWLDDVPHGQCNDDSGCLAGEECVNRQCVGYNRGFLRDEASLEIVFVSDEEDQSPSQLDFYVDFFKSIKGFRNEGLLRCWAIVGDEPRGCQTNNGSADAGRRYIHVANATGGRFHSLCDAEFAQAMADIGHTAFALRVQFFLSRVADPDSVRVEVDGQEVAQQAGGVTNWEYDPDSNSVIFLAEGAIPQPNQRITIRYRARCFPI